MHEKCGRLEIAMDFGKNEGLAPMSIEKIKILGAVLELPANNSTANSAYLAQFLR